MRILKISWLSHWLLAVLAACSCDAADLRTDGGAGDTPASDASSGDSGGGNTGYTGGDVEAIVTADNNYSFGWGDPSGFRTYVQNPGPKRESGDIFNCPVGGPDGDPNAADSPNGTGPERFIIPATDIRGGRFLYVFAWADTATSQGMLATFREMSGAQKVTSTGDSGWEVCATGVDKGNRDELTQADALSEIANCDAASGDPATTSAGWVNVDGAVSPGAVGRLAVGEDNSEGRVNGQVFPITCQNDSMGHGMAESAKWMWYAWSDSETAFTANGSVNDWKDFLIFRLGFNEVVSVPLL